MILISCHFVTSTGREIILLEVIIEMLFNIFFEKVQIKNKLLFLLNDFYLFGLDSSIPKDFSNPMVVLVVLPVLAQGL